MFFKAKQTPLSEAHLNLLMKKADIPGLSIAYVDNKGEISTLALGTLDASKATDMVTTDTVFQAASLSKPLFAYLVLKIIESKRFPFTLDEPPLHQILRDPRITGKQAEQLTARMVLSHTTGLPNIDADLHQPHVFQFEPGTAFAYSGVAYQYLQKVIEEMTGQTLEQLARVFIFQNMPNSSYAPEPGHYQLAVPHDDNKIPQPLKPFKPIANAAASLHTTATDYAKFLRIWLNDHHLQMAFDFANAISMTKDSWATKQNIAIEDLQKVAWGLGWGLQQSAAGLMAFQWGDIGDMKAFTALNLDKRTAVVYLANSWNGLSIAPDIVSATVGDLGPSLRYLFGKYGYEHYSQPDWKEKQNRQGVENLGKYQLGNRPNWEEGLSERWKHYLRPKL